MVWLSDNGPEFGQVKWLGILPDVSEDWMAGVDFDNPVGSGTGLYNDQQLFEAPMNHASLVPVIGLMKAEDFGESNIDVSYKSQRPPPRNNLITSLPTRHHSSKESPNDITGHFADMNIIDSIDGYSDGLNSTSNIRSQQQIKGDDCNIDTHESNKRKQLLTIEKAAETQANGDDNSISTLGDHEIGSLVEITIDSIPRYGVIRWIGDDPNSSERNGEVLAGLELEEEIPNGCDGSLNGQQLFTCTNRRGYFVPLNQCRSDSRFNNDNRKASTFGAIDCPTVTGDVVPLSTSEDLASLCGKNRGIQGHHNSCYLDATLFAMFSCTTIFESLLHRPPKEGDIAEYNEVQRVLKEEIVNPLRANLYVRADRVMHLRTLLEKLSSVEGLTSEEKDPEEFLNLLLNQILKAEPYLKLSSGLHLQESFFYQLFVEKDEKLTLPNVQQLFDQSFLASDIKLMEVPPALLIQMPRFGRQFKMYPRIIPSLYLDITDVLENSPRQCCICGLLAEVECKECFGQLDEGLGATVFCFKCWDKTHNHKKRCKHKYSKLTIPAEYSMLKEHSQVPRIYMELFAVLCIETSHYVAFVKCGSGPDAPWCFFDSMADRKGE